MAEGEENYRGSELQRWLKVKGTTGSVNHKMAEIEEQRTMGFPQLGFAENERTRSGEVGTFACRRFRTVILICIYNL